MITPFTKNIKREKPELLVEGALWVERSYPILIRGNKPIDISKCNIKRFITHNPYSKGNIRNWETLHNSKKNNITVGIYGSIHDQDIEEKIKLLHYLKDKLNRNIAIKTLLLDQTIIVGIGNIYADEILFLSKINPLRKGYTLTNLELENIIKYTKEVLEKAISQGGTTIRTYSSVNGIHGLFQQELLVHGKNSNCPICQEQILKIRVGGRGTYYCNNCQK